jgi:hypothetical protein
MASPILLDNDIVLKTACYSLAEELLASVTTGDTPPAVLGVGKYVVRGRLQRDQRVNDIERALAAFARIIDAATLLEPDENELTMAADLEAEANRRDLDLDGGESQLLAILANRSCRLLVTGDKRAIIAIAAVAPTIAERRIGCLEQVMVQLIGGAGVEVVRERVCAEPDVDRAVTICFGCSRAAVDLEEVLAGLSSYIRYLSTQAPDVLISGDDLSDAAA